MLKYILTILLLFGLTDIASAQYHNRYRYNYNYGYSYYNGFRVPAYPYAYGPYGNYGYNPLLNNGGYYNYNYSYWYNRNYYPPGFYGNFYGFRW